MEKTNGGEMEDALDQDIQDKSNRGRKNEVLLNYDEDSSDEDFVETKLEVKPADNDNDDDMFASDEELAQQVEEPKPSTFLGDFENEMLQEHDDDVEIDVSDPESDQDLINYQYYNDPESAHGQVSKAEPKFDAFNLEDEKDEGLYDEDGNFVRNADLDSEQEKEKDSWYLDHAKKDEIEMTRRAQLLRDQRLKELETNKAVRNVETLLSDMITQLEPAETPKERLQALNASRPKNRKQRQSEDPDVARLRKWKIETITSLANELMDKGRTDIYDETREELMRLYSVETGEDYKQGTKRKHQDEEFEFKYPNDTEIHGPYPKEQIIEWKESYFDDDVLVRAIGDKEFTRIIDFV